jgi:uncharacterized membrane protein
MFKKNIPILILLGIIFLLATYNISQAQEKIDNYNIDVIVNKNATVNIVETIDYNFGEEKHHGIYRVIPIKYSTEGKNNRSIKIKKIKVLMDGESIDFSTKKIGKNLKIKIGNPHKLISGQHRYRIDYQVLGALNYFAEHTELYWNVIGDEWEVGIEKAMVKVIAPKIIKQACFFGIYGSIKECQIDKNSIKEVNFIFPVLKPGEGGTIVVGIEQDEIIKPTLWQQWLRFLLDNWVLFLPGIFLFWGSLRWWNHGRDPKGRGTIIPYYDVPDNLSVAEVSAILHNSLRSKDISAMIIQLAVKGFIKIKQEKVGKIFKHTNYIFHKSKEYENKNTQLTAEEKYLLKALFEFGDDKKVTTDELKEKFYKKVSTLKTQVLKDIEKKGYLPMKTQYNGGMLIIIGVLQMIVLAFLSAFIGTVAIISGIISSVILVFFAILMGHRTKKGVEAKEKLLGLKMYLETAEKDRLKFHNAPAKNPQQFEKLLPYAMVFGVEKEWAEQFRNIYKEQPEWYEGANGQTFNSVVLANSLNSFGKTTSSSVVSAPSSAGSGGSGFSGGGSGGGFGGGGGGSW